MGIRIVGHRGGRNLWPENSLSGFRNTVELGIDAVEFDVHPTSDGGLVVIHDPTLERTTVASGPIATRSAAELARIALKDAPDEHVPCLAAVLALLAPSGLELHVELKGDVDGRCYPGLAARTLAAVEAAGVMPRTVLTSFDPEVLAGLRHLRPQARLLASLNQRSAAALGGPAAALERFCAVPIDYLAVEQSLLRDILPDCRARFADECLGAWVVNEPADLAYWFRQPIGLITSDRPDLALKARG